MLGEVLGILKDVSDETYREHYFEIADLILDII